MRNTKIIATLGPASKSAEVVVEMAKEGAEVFRINFSHGTAEEWDEYVRGIREAETERGPLSLAGDLQGPNARLGYIPSRLIEVGESLLLEPGDSTLERDRLPIPHEEVFDVLEVGDLLLIGDGVPMLKIEEVQRRRARAIVVKAGRISSRASVAVLGKRIPLPLFTKKDKRDLEYAVKRGFSHLMVSFVDSPKQLIEVRRELESLGAGDVAVFAKIETREGVRNLDEILRVSDGIVIARGDLGKHFGLEELPSLQRSLIVSARSARKPVYVATQLLTSMLNSPVPTRSEVVDVYNAVLEGVDGLMLTAETAVGAYPVEAVAWLARISTEAEKLASTTRPPATPIEGDLYFKVLEVVRDLAAKIVGEVVVYSFTGRTAEALSSLRPHGGFYVGVPNDRVARRVRALWGARPIVLEARDHKEGIEGLTHSLIKRSIARSGSSIIRVYSEKSKIFIEVLSIE